MISICINEIYIRKRLYLFYKPNLILMPRRIIFFFLFGSIFLFSCKFTEVPTGVYTGTYTPNSWNYTDTLPVSSGNGTLTITEAGNNKVNAVFSSPGNPDVMVNDLALTRLPQGFDGNWFEMVSSNYNDYPVAQGVYAYSYNGYTDHIRSIEFTNYDSLGFTFTGKRQ
jgi:hypothetical protein